MPPSTKAEPLAAERIENLASQAEADKRGAIDEWDERIAETTLMLITSRAQAIELLREVAQCRVLLLPSHELRKRIAAFLKEQP